MWIAKLEGESARKRETMEDNNNKRREAASSGGALPPMNPTDTSSAEPHSVSRRRGGALKRNNLSSAMFNSTPSKRFMREKAAIAAMQSIHSGPCTRAAAASAHSASPAVSIEPVAASVKAEDESSVSEEWKALENATEAEYEVVRSRGAGVHVVPNHCGWFSWTKHHPLEDQALPSFFDGKSETRTPNTYMEIRNWIVKKFHLNPNKQIEIKDLEDLNVGDVDARQEVMEFLDYWGLINFHPFPQTVTDSSDVKTDVKEQSYRMNDLAEKLFKFETMQWCPPVFQNPTTPTPLTPKVAEPTIPDESVKPEGPSVEYHCNSCSTDCSRKRYHCQKQADFDLCTECFNNEKFGSDMSSSDFILMEPAEAPVLSSGIWTDQETLLLLEALELFEENWNEIAEHVATKTKDQCILHFVQMPIEDSFLDSSADTKEDHPESDDTGLNNNIRSAPEESSETTDGAHCASEGLSPSRFEKSKTEDAFEDKVSHEEGESVALKALREAFELVSSLPEPGFEPTFADAGNPVMAMAVFLARFVGSDAATASSRNSLKALSGSSPGIELATRHCFILEGPPSDMKDSVGSESMAVDVGDPDSQNDGKKGNAIHTETDELSGDLRNCKPNESVEENSSSLPSPNGTAKDKLDATKERGNMPAHGNPGNMSRTSTPKSLYGCMQISGTTKTGRPAKKSRRNNSSNGEPLSQTAQKELKSIGSDEKKSGAIITMQNLVDKNRKPPEDFVENTAMEDRAKEILKKKDAVETALIDNDSVKPSPTEGSKDEAASPMKPSNAIDETDPTANSNPEVSGSLEGDAIKTKVQNSGESKENLAIEKVKRAAITTLAAAAVKAQLLAEHEEEEIKKLAVFLIDKQLRKLEIKMALFDDLGNVTTRVKEQLDKTRQKFYQERAQIIAARLGLPSSHPRPMSSSMPQNRNAINFANSGPRPPVGIHSFRPPIGRPTMSFAPAQNNPFPPTTLGRSGFRPPSQ